MQIVERLEKEEISLAPFAKRVLAYSVDELIVTFLFLIIYWDAFAAITTYDDARNLSINFFWQIFALKVIYHAFFCLVLWRKPRADGDKNDVFKCRCFR